MVGHIDNEESGKHSDGVPLVVGEELIEASLEHARRRHEQPMGRVDHFHIAFMIQLPYLGEEGFVRIDDSGDFLFEGANNHGVGHDEGQRMVKLHLLVHILQIIVAQHDSATGMMLGKGGNIEDVIIQNEQVLFCFLGVGLHLFVVFKFEVDLFFLHLNRFNIINNKRPSICNLRGQLQRFYDWPSKILRINFFQLLNIYSLGCDCNVL